MIIQLFVDCGPLEGREDVSFPGKVEKTVAEW